MKNLTKTLLTTTLMIGSIATATPSPTKHNHNGKWHTHVAPSINHTHNKAKKRAPAKQKAGDLTTIKGVKEHIKSNLKDPFSAKFGEFWYASLMKGETQRVVCGYVNAKNSYGSYTGNRLYVAGLSISKKFEKEWLADICKKEY